VDLFDSIGTFVGVAQVGGFVEKDGTPVRMGRALLVDAFSTTISGLLGTSPGTVYVESVAGIKEGGRSGLTAVITGLIFLPFMFVSPLISLVPTVATAPVLVVAGLFMTQPLAKINWKNFEEAFPAFLTFVLIPLTFSITQGVIWGFLSYTILKLALGKKRDVHWIIYVIDLFILLDLFSRFLAK
jgi:AGZA family xanthine/uracil permease-like MFS transporter